jgi:hypothetical protein
MINEEQIQGLSDHDKEQFKNYINKRLSKIRQQTKKEKEKQCHSHKSDN